MPKAEIGSGSEHGTSQASVSTARMVSVGIPVYNGENFVSEAIESILRQTYSDLELIISDNASSDRTELICKEWAERDSRVRYYRNERNLGASANYTRVFKLARGTYFKWAAHDDVYAPTYVEKCVDVLANSPEVVLCHSRMAKINESGENVFEFGPGAAIKGDRAQTRFRLALRSGWYYVWGLGRRHVFALTNLLGPFLGHDHAFVSRLSLIGGFHELPEPLCLIRDHPARYSRSLDGQRRNRLAWYDPDLAGSLSFPLWRLLREHAAAVLTAPIDLSERAACLLELGRWISRYSQELWCDAIWPVHPLPGSESLGSLLQRTGRVVRTIRSLASGVGPIIVVDDNTLDGDALGPLQTMPFIERDGYYWGPPETDEQAVLELERLRARGARYIAITEPSMWWLKEYSGFHQYLRDRYRCAVETDVVVAFDLSNGRAETA